MSAETQAYQPIPEPVLQPNQFELAALRNEKGKKIGKGTIIEHEWSSASSETSGSVLTKAFARATRPMQAPRGVVEQSEARTGLSNVKAREQASANRQTDIETAQLLQADYKQTEKALDATRSALKSEAATQAGAARPQSQDRNEGIKQPLDNKVQKPEMEELYLVSKDGKERIPFTVPKNATLTERTQAIQALGGKFTNYEAVYTWTPRGMQQATKDLWKAVKKAWQVSEPPTPIQK